MSAEALTGQRRNADDLARVPKALLVWLPIIAAALLLYIPAYYDVESSLTTNEAGGQQPLCLALWVWLIWHDRVLFNTLNDGSSHLIAGWLVIVGASLLYAVGRSQEFLQLEIGSQVFFFCGAVLLLLPSGSLRKLWFPVLFLAFLVPVPGSTLNAVLVPLKKFVSAIVAEALYSAGLPVARDGVVLYVGHYQLLIADACSGLNSMVALSAIGLLYIYMAGYKRVLTNVLLLAAVLPLAFLANVVRVAALVLTTYYGGDELGQRLHGYAALAEIFMVFGAFLLLDRAVRRLFAEPEPTSTVSK